MEVVDNAILLVIPGAMDAGLGDVLFWGSLSFALAIAFVVTVPVNRWLLARGKGHTAVHETGIHGGPAAIVGAITIAAFIFGLIVLITSEDAILRRRWTREQDSSSAGRPLGTGSLSAFHSLPTRLRGAPRLPLDPLRRRWWSGLTAVSGRRSTGGLRASAPGL